MCQKMQVLVINRPGLALYTLNKYKTRGICSTMTRETLSQFRDEWDKAERFYGQFEYLPAPSMTEA